MTFQLSKTRQDQYGTLIEDVAVGTFASMKAAKDAGDLDAGQLLEWEPLCDDGRLWAEPDWSDFNWFIAPVPPPRPESPMADRDLIAEGLRLRDAATPGPYEVLEDNGSFAHLQSLYRIPKDGWRERVGSNMQSRNATWMAWLLNNGPALLAALEAARTAIDSVQTAHELQLTRLAKDRAKAERKIVRLTAELEAAQRPPLGYLAVNTRSEVVLTKGYWGTLAEATSGWGSSSRATIVELREVQP